MHTITQEELNKLAEVAAGEIYQYFDSLTLLEKPIKVFGVPRGGVSAALAIGNHIWINLVDNAKDADIIIDDLIDSGRTLEHWVSTTGKPFVALLDKREPEWAGKWVVFPWEGTSESSIEDNIVRILQFVGEDAGRGGLLETPARVARAWQDWCSGYGQDPASVLKVFEDGAENYDQMIIRKNIPIYSHCEHHMAPVIGRCTIAYIPNGKIVGLSKLDRLADIFARRLQVQERLTNQIADALEEHLKPIGVGVWLSARHLCIESRGVKHSDSDTITTALRGAIMREPATRAEFLQQVS